MKERYKTQSEMNKSKQLKFQYQTDLFRDICIDPSFSENSFGFRPERNQQQAVQQAQKIVQSGKEYVVDIDLSKFFDRINHDRLIYRLKGHIQDSRILRLVGMILRGGIMIDGVKTPLEEGSVQGSPLSPLLSNVVLDELDKELERNKHMVPRMGILFQDDSISGTIESDRGPHQKKTSSQDSRSAKEEEKSPCTSAEKRDKEEKRRQNGILKPRPLESISYSSYR